MQGGTWTPYIRQRMSEFFDPSVIERIESGIDASATAFKLSNEKKSILYDLAATISVNAKAADIAAIDLDTFFAFAQERHLLCNALNDVVMRFDWTEAQKTETGTGIGVRIVAADAICDCTPSKTVRDQAVACWELVPRHNAYTEKDEWTWEHWDVSNPGRPYFAIFSADRKRDLTPVYHPELYEDRDGKGAYYDSNGHRIRAFYPYFDKAGQPIFPYVWWHTRIQNRLWDWKRRSEIVDGTLTAACLRTWFVTGLRDLAHPQRAAIDLAVPGASSGRGSTEVDRLHLDASAILFFRSIGAHPLLTKLDPAMDPEKALDAIERYNASLLETDGLGIEPTNTSRMSGYAIVVSRESLRRVQRQQTPPTSRSDRRALATIARMLNAYQGTNLPERPQDYGVSYHGVELSLEEIRSRLEQVAMLRKGEERLITRADALRLVNPHLSDQDVARKLEELDAEGATATATGMDELRQFVDAAAEQLLAIAEGPGLDEAITDRLGNVLALLGRCMALLEGQAPAGRDDAPETLTDPSSGAPMRTPRGVATTNRE